jgi:ABC-type transport system involved in cytochrome c biogenesis permease component
MTFLPVVERELRVAARRKLGYWLRVAGAAAGIVVLGIVLEEHGGNETRLGGALFAYTNAILFFAIWLLVPLMASDCISRERREGTLGLLFLTPLSATGVVLGKVFGLILRSGMVLASVLPVLTIPFLAGGVSRETVLMAVCIDVGALWLALAAGLVASSLSVRLNRAAALAVVLAGLAALAYMSVITVGLVTFEAWLADPADDWGDLSFWAALGQVLTSLYEVEGLEGLIAYSTGAHEHSPGPVWQNLLLSAPPSVQTPWLSFVVCLALASSLCLWCAIRIAAVCVRRAVNPMPPAGWRARLLARLSFMEACVPWEKQYRIQLLDRNPLLWLHRRSRSVRAMRWILAGAVASVSLWLILASPVGSSHGSKVNVLLAMGTILIGAMSYHATAQFKQGRDSGALEMIMLTQLSPRQIAVGSVRGVWFQFAPAFIMLVVGWLGVLAFRTPELYPTAEYAWLAGPLASTAMVIPVVGIRCSTTRLPVFPGWLLTCAWTCLLPFGASLLLGTLMQYYAHSLAPVLRVFGSVFTLEEVDLEAVNAPAPDGVGQLVTFVILQTAIALSAWIFLCRSLRNRSVALQRT